MSIDKEDARSDENRQGAGADADREFDPTEDDRFARFLVGASDAVERAAFVARLHSDTAFCARFASYYLTRKFVVPALKKAAASPGPGCLTVQRQFFNDDVINNSLEPPVAVRPHLKECLCCLLAWETLIFKRYGAAKNGQH